MVKRDVITALIDSKKAAVLNTLLESSEELYLKEISDSSKVPISTTFRILQELTANGLVAKRKWKTSKVYSCPQNDKVEFLKDLFTEEVDAVQEFVSQVKGFQGIKQIIMHGEQSQGKANVILIGEYINENRVREVCDAINKKGFELSFLTLTQNQYSQMSRMGIYKGEKKVLK